MNPINAVLNALAAYLEAPTGPALPPLYEALETAFRAWREAGSPTVAAAQDDGETSSE